MLNFIFNNIFFFIKNSLRTTGGQFQGNCEVTFIQIVSSSLSDTETSALGESLLTGVITTFVSRTSAGTLLNPSRYPGATVVPATSTASIATTFMQTRPNGQTVTTMANNSSQTTMSPSATTMGSSVTNQMQVQTTQASSG